MSLALSKTTITVKVQDRGVGISPEHMPRIFESFYTTKTDGMGLGLSIVQTIVAAHGGAISVKNRQPHGAAFYISLPRLEHKAPMEKAAE